MKFKRNKDFFTVSRIILSILVIILSLLQILHIWDKSLNIAVPLLSVLILIQSIQEHKANRKVSALLGYFVFLAMIIMILFAWL